MIFKEINTTNTTFDDTFISLIVIGTTFPFATSRLKNNNSHEQNNNGISNFDIFQELVKDILY